MSDFTRLPDLAARLAGGSVVAASDEFFAEKENLISAGPAVFQAHTFGHRGQVYDGWETRRRRSPGHDWAIVRLGMPGVVRGVVIDTAHFTGNYPTEASVQACAAADHASPEEVAAADWIEIVPRVPLRGDAAHPLAVSAERRFTHVRLTIHPDGGVARLRVHGEVVPDPRLLAGMPLDLAALENGALVTDCSDLFYARPDNLISPGYARVMGDGWETARRRFTERWEETNDWVTLRLAGSGVVRLAELDTTHFRGNAPGAAALHGLRPGGAPEDPGAWSPLLHRTRLQPDTRHRFVLAGAAAAARVRLDIYPDGGMARLRLFGDLTEDGAAALARRYAETTGPC